MPDSAEQSPRLEDGRLIFSFAHDVRTLLRTLATRIQMVQLSGAALLSDTDRTFLSDALAASTDIDGLLSAMVAYCSVTPGDATMGLQIMLRGLLIEMKDTLVTAGAEVSLHVEADCTVPLGLKTVFKELVLNSCRFRLTDVRPQIQIALTSLDDCAAEVTVCDNGPGVEGPYLDKIFEPFQRLHPRSRYPGYGLGLALCRRIVSANGGSIRAEDAINGGLLMRIRVPLVHR